MTKISPYLEALIGGKLSSLSFEDEREFIFGKPERGDYQHYISRICKYIEAEINEELRNNAYVILNRIILPEPESELIDFLMTRLNVEQKNIEIILIILTGVTIPEETDLKPLKKHTCSDKSFTRSTALEALAKVANGKGEPHLLHILQRTENSFDIYVICKALAEMGSVYALPVLMARISPGRDSVNQAIMKAVKAISETGTLDEEQKSQLMDIEFWRPKWVATAVDFVHYMELFAQLSGCENQGLADQLGEIFAVEMRVDYSPFTSFKELRVCSAGREPSLTLESLTDHLKTNLTLSQMLKGTAIMYSEESMHEKLCRDLMQDFLKTRLFRYIQFPEEDY